MAPDAFLQAVTGRSYFLQCAELPRGRPEAHTPVTEDKLRFTHTFPSGVSWKSHSPTCGRSDQEVAQKDLALTPEQRGYRNDTTAQNDFLIPGVNPEIERMPVTEGPTAFPVFTSQKRTNSEFASPLTRSVPARLNFRLPT